MLKKVNLKKRFSFIAVTIMILVLMLAPASVQAAANPLAKMPTKCSAVVHKAFFWKGANYVTPYYDSRVRISVRSSNPKVVTVKGESYADDDILTDGKKKYAAGYTITPVSGGTAKIYVKVIVNGKTYRKTCIVRSYKWESPVTNLKIGSTSYQAKFNKTNFVHIRKNTISGKVYYKVKPGFNVNVYAYYYTNPKNKYSVESKAVKSGQALPQNTYEISITGTSKKNAMRYIGKMSK